MSRTAASLSYLPLLAFRGTSLKPLFDAASRWIRCTGPITNANLRTIASLVSDGAARHVSRRAPVACGGSYALRHVDSRYPLMCFRSSRTCLASLLLLTACETSPRDFGGIDAGATPESGTTDRPAAQRSDAGTTDVSSPATADLSVDISPEAGGAVTTDSSEKREETAPSNSTALDDSTRGPETSLTTDSESSDTTLTCDGCTIDGACVSSGTESPDNPCLVCDPEQSSTAWVPNDGVSCSDGMYCNGEEACFQGECLPGTLPCEAQYCDEAGAHCCEPTNQVACGPSGNVHFLDTCGGFGEVSQSCAGACVEGSCRCVVYVNPGGSDENDGRSWAGAKRSIEAGIAAASADGCEVWVRAGTYKPGVGRAATFQLAPHVAVFGGFAGSETRRDQRDWIANLTVLSGEVGFTPEDVSDNAYHVVTGANDAVLDGFTITLGNAKDATPECGGGILNDGVSPTLRNLIFDGNLTFSSGADICNIDASPLIEHASFINSRATSSGGSYGVSMLQQGGRAVLRHALFEGRGGGTRGVGEGIANEGELLITNSEFRNLARRDGGGAIENANGAQLTIRDSLFEANSVSAGSVGSEGGAIRSRGVLRIVNSTFNHNTAGYGGAIAAAAGSVEIVGTRFTNNAGTSGGAITIDAAAVTVTNSLFASNTSSHYQDMSGVGGAIYVGGGGLTLINSTFVNNTAVPGAGEGGGGALHFDANSINSVSNCLFWNNTSPDGDDLYIDGSAVLLLGRNTYSAGTPCYPDRDCTTADPEFVPDWSTNGDFTPSPTSACREFGDDAVLPQDGLDVDGDLNVTERLPVDLLGRPRVVGTVDVGAFEGQ